MPNIRPILYGYDTTLVDSNSFQSIFDLALGLLNQLKANGWTSPTAKPLIFIAHSLGGLVLKQAFISLANRTERDDPIRQAIKGAIFFGVPNLGMDQSSLLAVVEGYPNKNLIADLSPNSKYLRQLDEQFAGISYLQDALLYWGYETRTSPTIIVSQFAVCNVGSLLLLTHGSKARMENGRELVPEKYWSLQTPQLVTFTKQVSSRN